jgi:hypothetical protein
MKRRPAFQRAESDPVCVERRRLQMLIRANRFLFVRLGYFSLERSIEDFFALARVKLKRNPSFAVVHAFHDGQRVRLEARTKLQAYISQLVLFAERNLKS